MAQSDIPEDKITAYKSTHYCVGSGLGAFTLMIDEYSAALEALYQSSGQICGAFITAYNPLGEMRDDKTNKSANQRLREHLRALAPKVIDGAGVDPSGTWQPEPSFFALGLDETSARLIGSQYRQDAVIWVDWDAIPKLILLR